MRHQRKTVKLGRSQAHRRSLLSNQVCSLIEHHRIRTTLAKAKAVRPLAERMVTLGKKGSLHARRVALSYLGQPGAVKRLFEEVAPRCASRNGGYVRIVKLGPRKSDAAPMAFLEWVDAPAPKDDSVIEVTPAAKETKASRTRKPKPAEGGAPEAPKAE